MITNAIVFGTVFISMFMASIHVPENKTQTIYIREYIKSLTPIEQTFYNYELDARDRYQETRDINMYLYQNRKDYE